MTMCALECCIEPLHNCSVRGGTGFAPNSRKKKFAEQSRCEWRLLSGVPMLGFASLCGSLFLGVLLLVLIVGSHCDRCRLCMAGGLLDRVDAVDAAVVFKFCAVCNREDVSPQSFSFCTVHVATLLCKSVCHVFINLILRLRPGVTKSTPPFDFVLARVK